MNSSNQPENQSRPPQQTTTCHPSVRKWIYLRGILLGLLVAGWWIMFAPDSMMESGLKIALGVAAGLLATGSYLYNLRHTFCPPANTGAPGAGKE